MEQAPKLFISHNIHIIEYSYIYVDEKNPNDTMMFVFCNVPQKGYSESFVLGRLLSKIIEDSDVKEREIYMTEDIPNIGQLMYEAHAFLLNESSIIDDVLDTIKNDDELSKKLEEFL
jgi:hypothetical protein